ncbi:MAG: HD domain-containing protein [Planctomycetes bacterium]|jgi:putative nucleotidyltransferase with HDIG domain|nr:HD domain-containing protein [Planctomycetota bacterium]
MATLSTTAPAATTYSAVPLVGLVGKQAPPFPLYLRTSDNTWVLYHQAQAALDESHLGRLQAEGIGQLFVRDTDRTAYYERVEGSLDQVLLDRNMPLERRADVLFGVAMKVADELMAAPPDKPTVLRAQRMMMATSGLLLRENQGFAAVRRLMQASHGLATHGLTVGFLSMGLARVVLGGDAATLLQAGLAGLLHDVGKVGHEQLDHDPEHAVRGAALLRGLGLPSPVVDAARFHHERHDGSGFPEGRRGPAIPELARVVGMVDTFDKVYSGKTPRVGVFDALRIMAQAYRGCFDDKLALGLVQLFR